MASSLCFRLQGVLTTLSLAWVIIASTIMAADKTAGYLTVNDVLTLPNHRARIEAHLSAQRPPSRTGWGGVSLQLAIDGKSVAEAKTDEGGHAVFNYQPSMRGTYAITVMVPETGPVVAEKAEATLCVWEHRRPILLVEMAAIMQPHESTITVSPIATEPATPPVPDAAEELSRLTQYYYNVMYVSTGEQASVAAAQSGTMRRWLNAHKFPAGCILTPSQDVNAAIEGFKRGGWTTMKSGVGHTRFFVETLLHQRMEVVVVPEWPKGELPRKAKGAKDWKEVRKKL